MFGGAVVTLQSLKFTGSLEKRSDTTNKGALSSCYSLFSALSVSATSIKLRGTRSAAQWSNISRRKMEVFFNKFHRRKQKIILSAPMNPNVSSCPVKSSITDNIRNLAYFLINIFLHTDCCYVYKSKEIDKNLK